MFPMFLVVLSVVFGYIAWLVHLPYNFKATVLSGVLALISIALDNSDFEFKYSDKIILVASVILILNWSFFLFYW